MLTYHRFVPYMSALYTLAFLEKQLLCIQLGSTSGYPTDSRHRVLYGNTNSGVKLEPRIRFLDEIQPKHQITLNARIPKWKSNNLQT